MDNKMTLNQFLPKWLEMAAKRKVKDTTFDHYQNVINFRILPILGHLTLKDLTGTVCQKFFNHLVDQELSERYIKYIYNILNTSLEKAIDWDLILKNPLRKVDLPTGESVSTQYGKEKKSIVFYNLQRMKINTTSHYFLFVFILE
ncbi:N-terminal phage integrase SAM-like domain-containing protein [Priestia sp. OVS21]|nr:N-terminal phage integrase SAM-like domain-containing protein [Priestia sp. OVS21]